MINRTSFLFITRLVVIKSGSSVYDQVFRRGVNIIRGDNGTGKSTIMDLIFFGLGGELTDWTAPPLSCDFIYLEIETSTGVYVLKRDIEETGKSPIYIFEGDYTSSVEGSSKWLKYLNRRTDERQSYSQQLFDFMLLPQHTTDDFANLTMHQILRLMYVDQITPPTKILRQESVFDSANTRRAIGEYLLGLDDLEVHHLRQKLLESEKNFAKIDGELRAIYRILGKNGKSLRADELLLEITATEQKIRELQNKKNEVRLKDTDSLEESQKIRINNLLSDIRINTEKLDLLNTLQSELSHEIIDSKLFLQSIEFRIKSLQESRVTNEVLGSLEFKYCPACLRKIESSENEKMCGLCKCESDPHDLNTSHLHMLNELKFQKRESEKLLELNKNKIDEIKLEIPAIESLLSNAKISYNSILQSTSAIESEISSISNEIGFAEAQIETLKERLEISKNIERLISNKEYLITEIAKLKEFITQKRESTKNRFNNVYSNLELSVLDLIKLDLDFETDFSNSIEFDFSFDRDKMRLNGKSKFSASSMVLLKNTFLLSILIQSTLDKDYRFPRLLLMDNIEDKGMMPIRSHNYQNTLVESCSSIKEPYQIIFTTSMISPKLDNSEYCRGRFYKKGTHTLEL